MCGTPAFRQGPRPFHADFHTRAIDSPNRLSCRSRVRGRFHCRHRMHRSFRRTQPSIFRNAVFEWATLK